MILNTIIIIIIIKTVTKTAENSLFGQGMERSQRNIIVHKEDAKEPAPNYRPIPLLDYNIQTDIIISTLQRHLILWNTPSSLRGLTDGLVWDLRDWFNNYVQDRKQRVVVAGISFTWAPLTSGVSQEIILGTILFNVFITDLQSV